MKLRVLSAGALALGLAVASAAAAADASATDQVRQVCSADFQKYCPDAKPGAGAFRACIRAHFTGFSQPCRHTLMTLRAQLQHDQSNGAAS